MEQVQSPAAAAIEVGEDEARVAYERLTLLVPGSDQVLVRELSVSVPRGTRLLIVGPNEAAKVALFRATAGIWSNGRGRIVRPGLDAILFLPERPYLPPGTIRDVLVSTERGDSGDAEIARVLHALGLETVLERAGGLDVERDWDDVLSLAGMPAPSSMLIDVARLEREYYERTPDPNDPRQRVRFGTSGHRGTSFDGTLTEAHILAIAQAICEYRRGHGVDGPLYMGKDTHALSAPAQRTALEVLAANGVETIIQPEDGATPTPAVSHAILVHNRGRTGHLAD